MCERDRENLVKGMVYTRTDGFRCTNSPHASGRSFRTAVVLRSAKNAPRCIDLK